MESKENNKKVLFNVDKLECKKTTYEFIKRTLDIVLSLATCIFALPLIAIICLCITLESKGNPILSQERVGKNRKLFKLYKIRSMYIDAENITGPKWADENDSRVTKIGSFIRKTRIDELPQLFNIIQGNMSIVGPRPERPLFVQQFENETPEFAKRLQVKPGLTGLAQVNGGYNIGYKEKLMYDFQYIQKQSIWLDIKIILKTIWVICSCKDAR